MRFFDIERKFEFSSIENFFNDWNPSLGEVIVIFSPHDDDALLGAGYLIKSALEANIDIYIMIFHSGDCGYSTPEMKDKIVKTRKFETLNAYKAIGIDEDHIIRLDLPDFSGNNFLGKSMPVSIEQNQDLGTLKYIITKLRELKTTRLIFANGYREHIDHTAVADSAIFYGPQVGDPVCVDWAPPSKIKSYLQYAVWGKFPTMADKVIIADEKVERDIRNAIKKWDSQLEIIDGILKTRDERKGKHFGYLELYRTVDPRPKMDYDPYKQILNKIVVKKQKGQTFKRIQG